MRAVYENTKLLIVILYYITFAYPNGDKSLNFRNRVRYKKKNARRLNLRYTRDYKPLYGQSRYIGQFFLITTLFHLSWCVHFAKNHNTILLPFSISHHFPGTHNCATLSSNSTFSVTPVFIKGLTTYNLQFIISTTFIARPGRLRFTFDTNFSNVQGIGSS